MLLLLFKIGIVVWGVACVYYMWSGLNHVENVVKRMMEEQKEKTMRKIAYYKEKEARRKRR
jgi:hypothetical protein